MISALFHHLNPNLNKTSHKLMIKLKPTFLKFIKSENLTYHFTSVCLDDRILYHANRLSLESLVNLLNLARTMVLPCFPCVVRSQRTPEGCFWGFYFF
ncbi:hypothetical protein Hanom_Chr09g00816111 [Helianthus anomalus]